MPVTEEHLLTLIIQSIELREIRLPLIHFFETSFGRTFTRDIVLIEAVRDGVSGWGEVTAGENPFYNEEWTTSVWSLAKDYIAPRILHRELNEPSDVLSLCSQIRGHYMAKGGAEAAVWDLKARLQNEPLWQTIGAGARREIACGVSIDIPAGLDLHFDPLIAGVQLDRDFLE